MAKRSAQGPIPQDGEEYKEGDDQLEGGEGEGDNEEDELEEELSPLEKRLKKLEDDNAATSRENAELRGELRGLKSGRREEPKAVAEEEDTTDYDTMLFTDPKGALKKYGDQIEKRITKALTNTYNKTTGEQAFWTGFYAKHPDLADDRDLVSATMNKHMADIADMPVEKAADKIADLTRQRILGYRTEPPKGKKAVAEGTSSPTPKKIVKEAAKVITLSDVIRNRRATRRGILTGQKKGSAA